MAKANLVQPDGTTVVIEGSAEEVAAILGKLSRPVEANPGRQNVGRQTGRRSKKVGKVAELISELAQEGFFKSKRGLGEIQKKLEEGGHIFPITTISPCLTRMTKKRVLRRLKEDKVWVYVN